MAANAGRFALRAEAAYVDTEDSDGLDPFTKNPFLFVVAGAVPFTYVGARLSSRLSPRALRLLLGFVLTGIALRAAVNLVQQLRP